MGASNYVHIEIDAILRETEKAFLVSIDGEEHWLPKSQIANADDYCDGDKDCIMSVTEFIAREKGFE